MDLTQRCKLPTEIASNRKSIDPDLLSILNAIEGQAYGMTGYSPAGSAVERVKKTAQGQEAAEEDRED